MRARARGLDWPDPQRHRRAWPGVFRFAPGSSVLLKQKEVGEEIARISQIVRSSGLKYSKRLHAFTKQRVAMLSSVLHSERAIEVNVAIMRAFVQLRRMIGSHEELARKLAELEARLTEQVLFLLYALCSMLHARPKALIGRQRRLGSTSVRNLQRTGPPATDHEQRTTDNGPQLPQTCQRQVNLQPRTSNAPEVLSPMPPGAPRQYLT